MGIKEAYLWFGRLSQEHDARCHIGPCLLFFMLEIWLYLATLYWQMMMRLGRWLA